MNNTYFPSGIAQGEAFYNRKNEIERLLENVRKNRHSLLISPRKYGKTSLAKYVISKASVLYAEVDLFIAIDDKAVEEQLIKGVKHIIERLSPTPKQWLNLLHNFLETAGKKWTIGVKGMSLELIPERYSDSAVNILDALNAVELVLAGKKQRAVLFIDEFQEISSLKNSAAIEGAIRHFAQEAKYLTLIFSGSNRHLLANMFDDRLRPLYLLCDRIPLDRIATADYENYLNKIVAKTWTQSFDKAAFQEIIHLTECHPYYFNILCDRLWRKFKTSPPTQKDIQTIWQEYVYEQRTEIRKELVNLGTAQMKLLLAIAFGENTELSRKEIQMNLELTSSAIVQALQTLEQRDYIEKLADSTYRIINPAMKTAIQIYYDEYVAHR